MMQTSSHARKSCHEVLTALQLVNGKDYQIFQDIHGVEEAITTNERHLFITGSFFGTHEGVAAFVDRMRKKNPQLVCLSFSIDRLAGPFDGEIKKSGLKSLHNLTHAILGFLNGIINRSEAQYEGKPFSYESYERNIGTVVNDPRLQAVIRIIDGLPT